MPFLVMIIVLEIVIINPYVGALLMLLIAIGPCFI